MMKYQKRDENGTWIDCPRNGNHDVVLDLIREGEMQWGDELNDVPNGSGDYRVLFGGNVHPTIDPITVDGCKVIVGNHVFQYDAVKIVNHGGRVYVECWERGELEDRFLIAE